MRRYRVQVNIPVTITIDGDFSNQGWRAEYEDAGSEAIKMVVAALSDGCTMSSDENFAEQIEQARDILWNDGLGHPLDFSNVIESSEV